MGGTAQHRFVFFLKRLLGIWYATEDMLPEEIVENALRKWRTPSAALEHLLQTSSPGINVLLAVCQLWGSVESGNRLADLQTLRMLLEHIPVEKRPDAIEFAAGNDTARTAWILTALSSSAPPGLAPLTRKIFEQWEGLGRSDELSLAFYRSLPAYGAPQEVVYWLTARTLVGLSRCAEAEPLLLELARTHPSPEVWWQLASVLQTLHRSPQQILWSLNCFIKSAPHDPRTAQALQTLGDLYLEVLAHRSASDTTWYLEMLRDLLAFFPEHYRAQALSTMAARHGEAFLARLLVFLPPPTLAGFSSLVRSIKASWGEEPRSDDMALQFYQALPAYGIPRPEVDLLLARVYFKREQYEQAELVLKGLVEVQPSPDAFWLAACVFQKLQRPARFCFQVLFAFLKSASSDNRAAQALKILGDVIREILETSRQAQEINWYMQGLRALLADYPVQDQAQVLDQIANHDEAFAARMLCLLPPPALNGLSATVKAIMARWRTEPRSDEVAIRFYGVLPVYGIPEVEAHLLLARAHLRRGEHLQAEQILRKTAFTHPVPDVLWYLATVYQVLQRPPVIQFEAWLQFISSAPMADGRSEQALGKIGVLFRQLRDASKNFQEVTLYLNSLRTLLETFEEARRVEVLYHIASEDDEIQALVLSVPQTPAIAGLAPVAQDIRKRWEGEPRSDELALRFYRSLSAYGIPQQEAFFLLARAYIKRKEYAQAEQVLKDLVANHPTSETLWQLADVYRELRRPPQTQHETLLQFVQIAGEDKRAGQAWEMIGDLRGEQLADGRGAVQAYQIAVKAEAGKKIEKLCAYYAGNWDAIPALRHDSDYPFPVVVTVDLEADPAQGEEPQPGSRIFEIAAVRYRGRTLLDCYQSYIQRDFCPAKWDKETAQQRLGSAPAATVVAQELQNFIADSIVVGHNLRAFDAPQLEGMGVVIPEEQMLDTLLLARLLHPDSLRHHLALLCQQYHIVFDPDSQHNALPDARACAQLFQALGESLARREPRLVTGIRALTVPGSAFDRAILQPRNIPADSSLAWDFDAAPTLPRSVTPQRGNAASQALQQALQSGGDQFIEHTDFDGGYTHALLLGERTLVTVGTRTRIERILAHHSRLEKLFVLPDPRTLLCPERLRQAIDACPSDEQKLLLFCLYQASHNHDAATLYPLCLPAEALDDPEISVLKETLLAACCDSESGHAEDCPARRAVAAAIATHPILLSTHEALLRQSAPVQADTIILDDLVHLQMHLAEYGATELTASQVRTWLRTHKELAAFLPFEMHIQNWAARSLPTPGYHERLHLSSFATYLLQNQDIDLPSFLEKLKQVGQQGKELALLLEELLKKAGQKPQDPACTHAYWIDLWFEDREGTAQLQSWRIGGIGQDLRQLFQRSCWKPFKKHLLAGPALSTAGRNTTFLERCLGLPGGLPYQQDFRARKTVYLPAPEYIPPAGFLQRGKWMMQVGAMLAARIREQHRSVLVTLNNRTAADALIQAFQQTHETAGRQLLATQLRWTVSKINERLHDPARRSLVFASPKVRQTLLDGAVDLEVSGSLRFLNPRDPLVMAQMQVFSQLFQEESPFQAYLLPQALLELQARLTSEAKEYILCDGGLLLKRYRDEVLQTLAERADVQELADQHNPEPSEQFQAELRKILANYGLDQHASISDADLSLILRSVWETDTFREFPPLDENAPEVSQKDVVRAVLDEKDQLVIAATGGGKSLCFQLPAIILAEEAVPKVTLVFSPLIALMSNQVEQLNGKGIFSAIMLNSSLAVEKRQEHLEGLKKGYYSIVYLAPEQIYSRKLREVLQQREIGLIAIDEAHCISQWGHNFRTDYFAIKKWIEQVLCSGRRRDFPVLALTATARRGYKDAQDTGQSDQASTVSDIIEKLGLRIGEDEVVLSSAIRPELEFHFEYITPTQVCPKCRQEFAYQSEIATCPSCGYRLRKTKRELQQTVADLKKERLLCLLGPDPQNRRGQLPDLYRRWKQLPGMDTRQRGLIYCAYQRTTGEIAAFLSKKIPDLRVGAYHAGMDNADRDDILHRFTDDSEQGLDVVVCTNAFGMGIDVRRLGFVIHFDTPATPEAYYQEAGRAGRDSMFGKDREKAQCILLFHPGDLEKQRFLSSQNTFSDYEIEDVYTALCDIYARDADYTALPGLPDMQTLPPTGQGRTIYASAQEIAERAGVQEEQVHTLLYYLEYQTKDKASQQPLLERGTFASNIWQLKFSPDYRTRLRELPPGSPSWPLVRVLQDSSDYRLSTDRFLTVSARELADSLHVSLGSLETELLNLVRRGIIQYGGSGQFKLNDPFPVLMEKLRGLEQDLKKLFGAINKDRKAFERNERVTVNLRALVSMHDLNTVTLSALAHLLFRYSLESSEPLRLLELFRRVTRYGQPDHYELQLWLGRDPNIQVFTTIHEIVAQLLQKLEVLKTRMKGGAAADIEDWYAIDVFAADLDLSYIERRRFHQQLILLETLGLLKYRSDPALGQVMQLTLLQPPVSREQLAIDLQSLRLQESYGKSKRKLMEQYATSAQKDLYAEQFARYFQGEKPLLEHNRHELRADLTLQQRQVAVLSGGTHVVEGPAGCGKTLTLAEHVKHLLNLGVPIDHIMITTHYTSAEGHIAEALKELESEGSTAISTTINAFGNKIFQQYRALLRRPDGVPYYRNAQVSPEPLKSGRYGEKELHYINRALRLVAERDFVDLVNNQRWPWPVGLEPPRFPPYRSNAAEEDRFQAAIHRFRQYGIFPTIPTTAETLVEIAGDASGSYSVAEFYAVYLTLFEVLAEDNLFTFDDQIVFALAILCTNPDILHEYQRYFEHIIVDELQDFSPAKVELLELLCGKHSNIMAFGDIFQEIQFDTIKRRDRREDIKIPARIVFLSMAQQDLCHPGKTHQLTVNFRSTQEILDFATFIRSRSDKRGAMRLLSGQNKHGPQPTYLYTGSGLLPDMIDAVLDQVEQLAAPERESVALIFSDNNMLHQAQNILKERNIPFSLMDGEKTRYQLHYVKNLLLYLYLIEDKGSDDDSERLLRYNIVPYFDKGQLLALRKLMAREGRSLFETVSTPELLEEASISREQRESLQHHLALINRFNLSTPISQLEEALRALPDGPLTLLGTQKEKLREVEAALDEFRSATIKDAIEEIRRHITFLDRHRGRADLVLASIEYSKSQEFETVFLIGVDRVFGQRLYVSVSRAKQRLFLVGEEDAFARSWVLSEVPGNLYTRTQAAEAFSQRL